MLVKGQWQAKWQPTDRDTTDGTFVRKNASLRNWVTPDGAAGPSGTDGFAAQSGRYHLYVALTCPWASRALMAIELLGLKAHISVSVVHPVLTDQGWIFGGYPRADNDPLNSATYLHEIYTAAVSDYTGRATVPVLWDKIRRTIVNNESADILRMLNDGFSVLSNTAIDLYPLDIAPEIDALNSTIYILNNGVYRAGLAETQAPYELAVHEVFATLDLMEKRLQNAGPFLFGPRLTESDIRLFVTLVRFDIAYHGIFKCNLRRLADYPALSAYADVIYALPGIDSTVSYDHIKRGYYAIATLNPSLIVPVGPLTRDLPGAN